MGQLFTKCNLFVVGDRGVGKTTLIKSLEDFRHSYYETYSLFKGPDWVIHSEKTQVEVRVREFGAIEKLPLNFIKKDQEEKTYILYVINFTKKSSSQQLSQNLINKLKELSEYSTLLFAITFSSFEDFSDSNIASLKKKLPFIEYFFKINPFRREYKSLIEFSTVLRRIILNKNPNELSDAKSLIQWNYEHQEKQLDLGRCNLTSLNEVKELFNNTHLEILILSNEWGEYVKDEWERRISNNKLEPNTFFSLPKEISKLKNLKVLICGGNWRTNKKRETETFNWHITDISPLLRLTNLEVLNLSNNDIDTITPVARLSKIEKLYLNNNYIKKFPINTRLLHLKELYLSNNRLQSVEFISYHPSLRTIDLHSNRIEDLTPIKDSISKLGIKDSSWEHNTISISKNPISVPPMEVVSKGKRSVLAYFMQLEAEEEIDLKPYINTDVKLIVVGNSNVGKSTYVHWLKTGKVDKEIPSTHWLELGTWLANRNGKAYHVRIFDFGGQEYYHDTHHLFFTNRTAYVLLWDSVSNQFGELEVDQIQNDKTKKKVKIETFPIGYWLDSIRYHSQKRRTQAEISIDKILHQREREIEHSIKHNANFATLGIESTNQEYAIQREEENILVTQNKVDHKKLKFFANEELLKTTYPKIYDFTEISVYNNKGLDSSNDLLFDIFDSLEVSNRPYLGTWNYIKQDIEKQKFNEHHTFPEFLDYCNKIIREIPELNGKSPEQIKNVLFTKEDAEVFASFLTDIGLCLYYPENNQLKDRVFLNQNQILTSLNKVLEILKTSKGELDETEITKSLGKTGQDQEVLDVIDLMTHFKILFKHPNKKTFIAPLYLTQEVPQSIKVFHSLFETPCYKFQYESYMHKSIILDFFQEYGKKALKETNDSTLYYYWKDGVVIKDEATKAIIMVQFVPANNESKSAFLDIYAINNSDDKFINDVINYIDNMNTGLRVEKLVPAEKSNDFVPLEIIHQNEKDQNPIFHYNKKYYRLTSFKKYLNSPLKMKKIFISYSKQDIKYVNKFIEHLSALQRDGKVSHWYCSELEAGSDWNNEIQEHLKEADIICFMISPNFMKADYILEHEVAKAFEKKKNKPDFKIVPIILDFCRWSTSNNDLSQYTALPYTAKPILDFDNQNMAWYIVEECLRLMIENDLEPKGENFYTKEKLPADVKKIYSRIVEGKVDKNAH